MSWLRPRWLPLAVLVAATATLVASIAWAVGRTPPSTGARWPAGSMMGTTKPGGPVRSLAAADRAAIGLPTDGGCTSVR
ncbi:MAG TPA: hypothetical protein VGJ63_10245 [Micromonosporaceae bacterium]|jgi:hypothetical protein